ncbi:capsular associated protein [Mycena floridula]|nr:capsular associated protein [Mycena floridula]
MLQRERFLSRRNGYLFVLCVFIAFMQAGFYSANRLRSQSNSDSTNDWRSTTNTSNSRLNIINNHPIPKLIADAEAAYRKKIGRQSKTLAAAVAEYRKRYKRPPPKGFDAWWEFAQQNDVVMVDEYDGLIEDLAPFWELSGKEFQQRSVQVASLPSIDLVRIRDGKASTANIGQDGFEDSEVSARAEGFSSMLAKFAHTLPDLDFPINAKAENRIVIPWEHRTYPNLTHQNSSDGIEAVLNGPFIPDWRGDGNVWDAWRRTCDPSSDARRLYSSLRNASAFSTNYFSRSSPAAVIPEFSFATTTSYQIDFCAKPYAHYSQGHFFSDWRTIPALYPVLSPAKARGFTDIRIPSHYYYGSTKRYTYGWDSINLNLKDIDDMEVPWERKENKIFWRGATTGGGSNPPGFSPQYQRHRFLRMTSDNSSTANRTVTFADPPTTTQYVSVPVPVGRLNQDIMDVAFVKATSPQTYPGGLQGLMADHRFGNTVPLGKHWSYKYLVDFDGMSYSGRFLAFLASDSVPVKSTVYAEFFSDWIQPWVHFIPLSSTYKEIYNIHAFFSGPTLDALEAANSTEPLKPIEQRQPGDGDARLRRIARAGKQWKNTIGRAVDMEAYVYRLCLEYARLSADDREKMNFSL